MSLMEIGPILSYQNLWTFKVDINKQTTIIMERQNKGMIQQVK